MGELALADIPLAGTVTARAAGTGLSYVITFTYPARSCGGTVTARGSQANGGRLLVGTARIGGTCGDHPEEATFAWRRE